MLDVVRTIAPTETPVTVEEAMSHLNADSLDAGIQSAIARSISAATGYLDGCDGLLGKALITQTWRLYLPAFYESCCCDYPFDWPSGSLSSQAIKLPLSPLQSVTEISYTDTNGDQQVLDPDTAYRVIDGRLAEVLPIGSWPTVQTANPRAVSITFVAGFADDAAALDIQAPELREAILLLISHWDIHRDAVVGVEGRDSSTELPLGFSALIAPYRTLTI